MSDSKKQSPSLEQFFHLTPDLLVIADFEGYFVQSNLAWAEVLGYPQDKLINRRFLEFVHPDDLEATHAAVVSLKNGQEVLDFTNRYLCADGSVRYLEWRARPEGNLIYAAARDVTARIDVEQALVKQNQLQRVLMDIANNFINVALKDTSDAIHSALALLGQFTHTDRAYIFSYDRSAGTCSNTYEWCAEGISPQISNLQEVPLDQIPGWAEAHFAGKPVDIPEVCALEEGSGLRQLLEAQGIKSLLALPMMNGDDCIGFLGFDAVKAKHDFSRNEKDLLALFGLMLVNVLNRHRTHKELNLAKEEAELAKEKAEAASKSKSKFLANMSHEIRTPLNGVIGFTELLGETELTPLQQDYLQHANVSGHTLLMIINDILDFSKIEAGMMELEIVKTDLHDLFEQSISLIRLAADKKNLAIRSDLDSGMPQFAWVDPVRLKQILVNLLSNAVKFTEKGEVTLRVRYRAEDGGEARFSIAVQDTGVGIPESQQSKLFKAFSQGDNSKTRQFGGTGLGLIISETIARKMNSCIKLDSTEGEGTTFSFSFTARIDSGQAQSAGDPTENEPQAKVDEEAGKPPASDAGDPVRLRILLAEDVPMNRFLVKSLIERTMPEAVIVEAENGKVALEKYEETQPDIVLMDIQMPEMDGIEATLAIRELEKSSGRRVPVIALTAGALKDEEERCLKAGMDEFLTKPIVRNQLEALLRKTVSSRQAL